MGVVTLKKKKKMHPLFYRHFFHNVNLWEKVCLGATLHHNTSHGLTVTKVDWSLLWAVLFFLSFLKLNANLGMVEHAHREHAYM